MKSNTELASQVILRIFKNSGAYSEQQVNEIIFHLTDWVGDFVPFANFMENPDKYADDEAMKIIIAFLAHVPYRLNLAAEIVLEPSETDEETHRH